MTSDTPVASNVEIVRQYTRRVFNETPQQPHEFLSALNQ